MKKLRNAFLILATFAIALPATAQDQFGARVAIGEGQIFVMKPNSGRGLSAVYVFDRSGSGWELADRLLPEAVTEEGEGISRSMTLAGNTFLVGSADPAVVYGAHVFRRGESGRWTAVDRLRLVAEEPQQQGEFNMAGLMAIMQPAQRSVASHGNMVAAAIVATQPRGVIRIMRQNGGRWIEEATVDPDNLPNGSSLGSQLALTEGHLAFTAGNQSGALVLVYSRSGDGTWTETGRFDGEGVSGSFGSSLAFAGNQLAVAAAGRNDFPGSIVFYRNRGGAWTESARVTADEGGDGFATSFAIHGNEMWVGAPNADSLRGRVDRYLRSGNEWNYAGPVDVGNEPGDRLGTSVALSDELAAAGAPFASTRGRVAVYAAAGGDWTEAGSLAPDPDPTTIAGGEVRCEDGSAAGFDCQDVDIESFLTIDDLGGQPGESVTDLWGWTDMTTRR